MDAHSAGETSCLGELFAEAERIVVTGGREERALIVEGLLEDLQGALAWAQVDPASFYALLGPARRNAWDDLVKLWSAIKERRRRGRWLLAPSMVARPRFRIQTSGSSTAASTGLPVRDGAAPSSLK